MRDKILFHSALIFSKRGARECVRVTHTNNLHWILWKAFSLNVETFNMSTSMYSVIYCDIF
jgi:hypothetical protein